MSTHYGLSKSIKADELFDGRLEAFGVREEVRSREAAGRYPSYMKVKEVRYLSNGGESMKVIVWENGYASLSVMNLWCAPEKEIFHAVAEAFDADIVTEHQPEFWGFATQEEWDAHERRICEEHEQQFYAELLKHVRGEPSDIRPGTIEMIQAEIAKRLVEQDISFQSPENKQKLLSEINEIYDRDHAVKVTLTPEQVVEAHVVAIMRGASPRRGLATAMNKRVTVCIEPRSRRLTKQAIEQAEPGNGERRKTIDLLGAWPERQSRWTSKAGSDRRGPASHPRREGGCEGPDREGNRNS